MPVLELTLAITVGESLPRFISLGAGFVLTTSEGQRYYLTSASGLTLDEGSCVICGIRAYSVEPYCERCFATMATRDREARALRQNRRRENMGVTPSIASEAIANLGEVFTSVLGRSAPTPPPIPDAIRALGESERVEEKATKPKRPRKPKPEAKSRAVLMGEDPFE